MAMKEGEGAALRPRAAPPRTLEEAGVPALVDEGRLDPRRLRDLRQGQGGRRDERIVAGVDEEHRPADLRQIAGAARALPVIALVGEAEDGRRHRAVVLGEGAGAEGG